MSKAKGVVAAGHKITAEAACEVLREGGNAFDAVIAAMITATVPEFVFSSIGGGGFLMARPAGSKSAICYDFFAHTPRTKRPEDELDFFAITADFGPASQEFHIGAGSTATPSFIQGLYAIHDDLGTVPMGRLFEPAVLAARDGVTVTTLHAYLYSIVEPILTASPSAADYYAPEGKLLDTGAIYRNAALADTVDCIAREGVRLFTEGEVAQAMVAQSLDHGGHLTRDDLRRYVVERRKPLNWRYRNHDVLLNPAPAASGALIAFGLALLERTLEECAAPDPVLLARVMEETNAVRMARGAELDRIVHDATIAEHLAALKRHTPATRGTTHISIIDEDGNAAAATITNGEGNGYMVSGCGFMLNNMLGEEDLNPGGFHLWEPDTRLSTMMAPTIVTGSDGSLTALGSGGANRIRTAVLQVIVNLIDRGVDLETAVNAARLHVERDHTVSYEEQSWGLIFTEDDLRALLDTFPEAHGWPEMNLFFGGVHTARRDAKGGFEGAGDPRREGITAFV
ncbi:MAG: gamma-glutamyltransferase [Hyphomicrobiaceae bacterium]|nr:gamma-glutamyltransferase [Hyphomicrobiaceae bacterium]